MKTYTIVLASLFIAACSSAPKVNNVQAVQPTNINVSEAKPSNESLINSVKKSDIESGRLAAEKLENERLAKEKLAADKLAGDIQALNKQSVYFDFDKFSVDSKFIDVIQQQAEFVKTHASDSVNLQGNTDERGSSEYNLALGDKRAYAVQKSLEMLGVTLSQINATSFGESQPRLECHDESCWKENRRVDFVHKQN